MLFSWKIQVLIFAVLSVYTRFFVAFYHKIVLGFHEIVSLWQLDQHKLKLLSDRTINQNELRKKLGQLLYLQNLAKVRLYNYNCLIESPCKGLNLQLPILESFMNSLVNIYMYYREILKFTHLQ